MGTGKDMNNKRVVITGGAGFIGSNLAYELAQSNEVIIIDDLSTGRESNLTELKTNPKIKFIQASILNKDLLEQLFKGIDYVFHQAAIPSVPRSIEDPQKTNSVNITGTLNVLMAARNNQVKKLVFASSSSVYGDTPTLPKREEMNPNPQSPYAVSKITGEYYCNNFYQIYKLPTIALRYFNIYGPRQDPKSQYAAVIPYFISQILAGLPLVIFGDGEQTRDFTFIKDTVKANIIAAESDVTGVFNIGSGANTSINNLAKSLMTIMNKDLKITFQATRLGDVRNSLADISKARIFGYQPQYSLEDGLQETVRRMINAG